MSAGKLAIESIDDPSQAKEIPEEAAKGAEALRMLQFLDDVLTGATDYQEARAEDPI